MPLNFSSVYVLDRVNLFEKSRTMFDTQRAITVSKYEVKAVNDNLQLKLNSYNIVPSETKLIIPNSYCILLY